MPRYEFRCRTCASTFEVDRPMSAASDPAPCPTGHDDTVKLLNTVGLGGKARTAQPTGTPRAMASPPGRRWRRRLLRRGLLQLAVPASARVTRRRLCVESRHRFGPTPVRLTTPTLPTVTWPGSLCR